MLLRGLLQGDVPLTVGGLTPRRALEVDRETDILGGDMGEESAVLCARVQLVRSLIQGSVLGKGDRLGLTLKVL